MTIADVNVNKIKINDTEVIDETGNIKCYGKFNCWK